MPDSTVYQITRRAYETPGFNWDMLMEHAKESHLDVTRRVLRETIAEAEREGQGQAVLFLRALIHE